MKSRGILPSIVLGAIGTLIPVLLAIYLSWMTAVEQESNRLEALARQVIGKTERVFQEASETLHGLDASTFEPCSPRQIGELRRLTINSLFIEEIGYVEEGVLRCTSWGTTEVAARQAPHDFETRDGVAVVAHVAPVVTGGEPVAALRVGNYNALLKLVRVIDIIGDQHLRVAVAHREGTILIARDDNSASLAEAIVGGDPADELHDLIVVTVPHGEFVTTLAEPSVTVRKVFARQLLMLGPIGMVMGGIIGGMAYWLARKRLSIAGEIALAVRRREFIVHYQPIIQLTTGKCIGAEALVRWKKADGSIINPNEFLPIAEAENLIEPITDQIIETVISDLGPALRSNRNFHVAVNFAARDIQSGRASEILRASFEGTRIEPSQIWLEVTEHSVMDVDRAHTAMKQARALGYTVVIDDFGTGYSSLQYLSNLPVDGLKIDKSFVDSIGKEAATSAVTAHIIRMAKSLDLFVVAEGVETPEQAEYLANHGVDYVQGWLYSRALSIEDFLMRNKAVFRG